MREAEGIDVVSAVDRSGVRGVDVFFFLGALGMRNRQQVFPEVNLKGYRVARHKLYKKRSNKVAAAAAAGQTFKSRRRRAGGLRIDQLRSKKIEFPRPDSPIAHSAIDHANTTIF